MAGFGYFSGLLQPLCDQAKTIANSTSTHVIDAVLPLIAIGLALELFFYGMAMVRGDVQAPFSVFLGKVTRHILITVVVAGYALGGFDIIGLAWDTQDSLVKVVSGNQNAFDAVDSAYVPLLAFFGGTVLFIMSNLNPGSAESYIFLGLLFLLVFMAGGVVILCLFYVVLAKMGLGILLGLGPLFIAASAFPVTARFFEAWVGNLLNFCLLAALSALTMTIVPTAQGAMFSTGGGNLIRDLLLFSIVNVVMLLLMLEIPKMASALTNGLDITGGIYSAAAKRLFYEAGAGQQFWALQNKTSEKRNGATSGNQSSTSSSAAENAAAQARH